MKNKLKEPQIQNRLQEILNLIDELRKDYDIAIDNTWANHYKVLLKVNEEIKEHEFTTYKDVLSALNLMKESDNNE